MLKKILILISLLSYLSIVSAQQPQTSDNSPTETDSTSNDKANAGTVTRAQFATAIQEREPSDSVSTADTSTNRVYFFTELTNMQGQTVSHRWSFLGEKMAEVNFNVGGNRWRVWSSKQMMPHWLGNWTVEVIASNGNVLSTQTLKYVAAEESETATSEESQVSNDQTATSEENQ